MPDRSLSTNLWPFGPHTHIKMKVEYPPELKRRILADALYVHHYLYDELVVLELSCEQPVCLSVEVGFISSTLELNVVVGNHTSPTHSTTHGA